MIDLSPGDKVICVDNTTPPINLSFPPISSLLTLHRAYVIQDVTLSENLIEDNSICLRPKDPIVRVQGVSPWWFEHWRFRKIVKSSQSVEDMIAQSIKTPVLETEDA